MSEGWQNQWGLIRLADFRVGKTLRAANPSELPKGGRRTTAQFLEMLATFRGQL